MKNFLWGGKLLREKKKGEVSETKQQSFKLDQNGISKGRKNKKGSKEKKMSAYATMRDAREAISLNQPLLVLLCKEVFIISNEITNSLPSVVDLLQVYEDLFQDEILNGLPPKRGIEHQIDFIPGASIPNRPAYRTNLTKTKEI